MLLINRRSRFFRYLLVVTFVILILYLLSSRKTFKASLPRFEKWKVVDPYISDTLGNFEPRNLTKRHGPGENGVKHILSSSQANDAQQSESEYGMNMVCSDEISLDRSVVDTRDEECKYWVYPDNFPTVSVIIVFHNEGWSVLLRTVHSVLNRSPKSALVEVLLVDDFSDKGNLGRQLEDYIENLDSRVRLIRNKQREGLIRTRSRGASEAIGEVIVFLDAHCEVNLNWLPPLLAPIMKDSQTMTVPIIDGVDHKHFEYRPVYQNGHYFRGIFEWGMLYKENELPYKEQLAQKQPTEPYPSPTHAGGLFAINRKYFLEIGAYDPGLLVWGGENFELSFKIWQCGGRILWVPCSRVGHVYRGFMPYNFGNLARKKKGPLITINYKRVIETWFDEKYKQYFYTREPLAQFLDMGDISAQLELKSKLKCKSFDWFMKNVAYDITDKFPELPPNLHWGELRSVATDHCLDTGGHGPPAMMTTQFCHGFGNNQLLRLNEKGQLGVGERCVEGDKQGIKLAFCRLGTVDGPWEYDEENKTLYHRVFQKCMALHPQTGQLYLQSCDNNNTFHRWLFKQIRPHYS